MSTILNTNGAELRIPEPYDRERFVCHIVMAFVEYHLQFVYKFLLASHQLNQTGDIVGNIESIVPGTTFV